MPDQLSKYYDYLKSNGADVAPSLESFKSTLSNEKTAKQYYSYLRENKFDAPETFDSFKSTFDLKKNENLSSPSLDLQSQSVLQEGSKLATGGVLTDISKGVSKQEALMPKPKLKKDGGFILGEEIPQTQASRPSAKIFQGVKPVASDKEPDIEEAVNNAVIAKNKSFGVTDKFDMDFGKDEIIKAVKEGDLVPIKENGKSKLVRGVGFIDAFSNAVNKKFEHEAVNNFLANANEEEKIKHLNNKLLITEEQKTAPSGVKGEVGQFLGENIGMLGKGVIAGLTATTAALPTGGGSFLQFLSMAEDMGYGGYASALENNYIKLKQQNPEISDKEAYDKANKAAIVGEVTGLATNAALAGSISQNILGKIPKPNIEAKGVLDGIINSAKHAVKSYPKVGGVSVAGSLVNDLASKGIGVDVKGDEILSNMKGSAVQMAIMHFGLAAMTEPFKIPSYIRPQVENIVASAPREEVADFYNNAEKNGLVPQGTTENVLTKLSEFDEQKAVLAKMPLSEEQKAAITGKLLQRKKIVEENKELQKYGSSFVDKIAENDKRIEQLDKETNGISKTNDVFKFEKDNLTGEPAKIEEPQAPIIKGEEEVISKPIELSIELPKVEISKAETLPALRDVENTAKALEGKDITTIISPNEINELNKQLYNNLLGKQKELLSKGIKDFKNNPEYKAIKEQIEFSEALLANDNKSISEAYHKAKADGSNPELVQAVESLLSKEQPKQEIVETPKIEKNAVQIESPSSVLQPEQEKIGETRGERGGMEQGKQGEEITPESVGKAKAKINEEVITAGKEESKPEKEYSSKGLDRAEAKKIHAQVRAMESPVNDANQIALRYIAGGGKVSEATINEVAGTVKRARLNTGEREFKSSEAKLRDYYEKEGETLDEIAHRLWQNSGQEVSERDIKDSLMGVIGDYNTRLEAGKAYLEQYSPEYAEEQYYSKLAEERADEFKREQEKIDAIFREPLDEELLALASEEHINNLINQYEAETIRESKEPQPTGETKVIEPISGRAGGEKPKKEAGKPKIEGKEKPIEENLANKARSLAAELRKGDKSILPDWLKADLPKGTKLQGIDVNEAFAKALETFADVYDKAKDFQKAIEEGFKHIKDYFEENKIPYNEVELKEKFSNQFKEEKVKSIKDIEELEGELVGLEHAKTEAKRVELGLPPRTPRELKTDIQLEIDANNEIQNGYDVKGLVKKIQNGHLPTDVEHIILLKYAAGLEFKLENLDPKSKEFEATFNEINQVYKASEKGGSELGAAFRARQKRVFKEDSLGDMLVREAEINMVEDLTEEQRIKVVSEYESIKKAKEEWEKKYNELVDANNEKEANVVVQKEKLSVVRKPNKTKDDFKNEREKLKQSIKDKWKKASSDGVITAVPLPYAKQLAEISPDVARLMRSYVEEGITDLNEVVKNIHNDIKDYIEDIKESDIRDVIAGVYNEKRTKNQLAESLRDLRDEAKLIVKLEAIEKGEMPKTEKKKIERNQKITELRAKIKELTKDGITLESVKTRTKNEITKLEEKLRKGDYSKEPQKEPIKLDEEALVLKDKLIKLKQEREIRLMQQEYENRTNAQKAKDNFLNVLNVPRTLMASADLSAPLRQGIIATIAHPKLASKAFTEMLKQSVSQKRFDRWFFDLRETPSYEVMEKSGLYIADPHDPRLSAKEEQFMNNIAEKIPIIGKIVKGSERAYVSYLNKMRVDLFIQGMQGFESSGMTIKNSPDVYKAWASFVNNSTGRGKMPEVLENAAPLLNSAFFSPRLMAARLNMLNPLYYPKLPKEVRIMALKDMAAFITVGTSILALSALAGADIEKDPRSPNFGKIKIKGTTYDIWGGFQQYIVEFSQLLSGQTKSATTEIVRDLDSRTFPYKTRIDDLLSFARGKLAPVPASIMNLGSGKKVTGERTNIFKEIRGWVTPLVISDALQAFNKDGLTGAFATAIPATFGVGVQTISTIPDIADKQSKAWKFVAAKKIRIPNPDLEAMKVGLDNRVMTKEEMEKFEEKRVAKIEESIDNLIKKGKNVDVNGSVVYKTAQELSQDNLQKEIEKISRKATSESKKELFGEKVKSLKEKINERIMKIKNKKLEDF